mgnify:CR=1 FL=1
MDFKGIQMGVESILNTKTTVRRRRRTASEKNKELFASMINGLDEIRTRQALMYADLSLDFSTYDERFFSVIDILLHMNFGPKCADIIAFYLYDRLNHDGTVNALVVNGKHEVKLNNPYELWDFLKQVNPKIDE